MTARTNIGRRMEVVTALLEHEARTGRGLGVVGVAEALGREKSLVSRALASLLRDGMVRRDPDTMEFFAGDPILALASGAGDPTLLAIATPFVHRVAEAVGERASLLIRRGSQGVNVYTAVAEVTVQAVAWRGRSTPLHCNASGRILMSELTRAEMRELVGPDPLPPAGPAAPRTFAALSKRVQQARKDGFAVSDAELDPDIVGIAAPIRRPDGTIAASLAITGPGFRLRDRVGGAVEIVVAAAAGCTQALRLS